MRSDFVVGRARLRPCADVDREDHVVRHVEVHEVRAHVAVVRDLPLFEVKGAADVAFVRRVVSRHRDGARLSFDERHEKAPVSDALRLQTRFADDVALFAVERVDAPEHFAHFGHADAPPEKGGDRPGDLVLREDFGVVVVDRLEFELKALLLGGLHLDGIARLHLSALFDHLPHFFALAIAVDVFLELPHGFAPEASDRVPFGGRIDGRGGKRGARRQGERNADPQGAHGPPDLFLFRALRHHSRPSLFCEHKGACSAPEDAEPHSIHTFRVPFGNEKRQSAGKILPWTLEGTGTRNAFCVKGLRTFSNKWTGRNGAMQENADFLSTKTHPIRRPICKVSGRRKTGNRERFAGAGRYASATRQGQSGALERARGSLFRRANAKCRLPSEMRKINAAFRP